MQKIMNQDEIAKQLAGKNVKEIDITNMMPLIKTNLIFKNDPTIADLRKAYKTESFIYCHFKTVKEALKCAKRIKRMPKKYHSRISIWFMPGVTREWFKDYIRKTVKNVLKQIDVNFNRGIIHGKES